MGSPRPCAWSSRPCGLKRQAAVLSYVFPPETLQEQYEENPIPVNRTTLVQCLIPIEESFEDFMTKLSRNEYEYEFDLEDLLE